MSKVYKSRTEDDVVIDSSRRQTQVYDGSRSISTLQTDNGSTSGAQSVATSGTVQLGRHTERNASGISGQIFTDSTSRDNGNARTTYTDLEPSPLPMGRIECDSAAEISDENREANTEKEHIYRRLKTFLNWRGLVEAIKLAISGFIFIGPEDKVQCETCKIKLHSWTKDDVPNDVHKKYSPNCGFMKKWFPEKSDTFMPSGSKTSNEIPAIQNTSTVSSNINPQAKSFDSVTPSKPSFKGYNELQAKYKQYVTIANRRDSFNGWPHKDKLHSVDNMALAGFYYIGSADRARCFYCGLTLRDWDSDDSPFESHFKYGKNCDYIKTIHKNKSKEVDLSSSKGSFDAPSSTKYTVSSSDNYDLKQKSVMTPTEKTPEKTLPQTSKPQKLPETTTMSPKKDEGASPVGSGGVDMVDAGPSETQWKYSVQVETLLAMGFEFDTIMEAINRKRQTDGTDFVNATELYVAVERLMENR